MSDQQQETTTAVAAAPPPTLTVNFFGATLNNPFMNAAGVCCRTAEDLEKMRASTAGAQITKSCTAEFRQGNPEPRYAPAPLGSINSMGLPNMGFAFYRDFANAATTVDATEKNNSNNNAVKPVFVSIAGMTLDEVIAMCKELSPLCVERPSSVILELNLSCPNVPGKSQVAYDFPTMEKYLEAVCAVFEGSFFGVKLPPYFDFSHFDAVAAILNKFPKVKFLTCINSVGNALVIDTEKEQVVIAPKQGFGGLGGQYVLPIALANVNAFARRCPGKVIIGCGGIVTGEHVFQHILAGATLVQVGTQLYEEGTGVFDCLAKELTQLMQRKGYKSVDEFRGKLKTFD